MHLAKVILAGCAAAIFLSLGVLDLIAYAWVGHHGIDLKVGIASLCLGLANALLLTP